jgi:hypothetical protein
MRSGKVEQATALAGNIGNAIKNYIRTDLSRVAILVDPLNMWTEMRQVTGGTKSINNQVTNLGITADILNDHYASISRDTSYVAPKVKLSTNNSVNSEILTEWHMFKILDIMKHTASCLDNIPSWFL